MVFWENVKKAGIAQAGREHGWIRRLAERAGINQVELANKVRKRTNLNVHDASRIAQALNTTVEALLFDGTPRRRKRRGTPYVYTIAVHRLKELIQKYKNLLIELESIGKDVSSTETDSHVSNENAAWKRQHYYAEHSSAHEGNLSPHETVAETTMSWRTGAQRITPQSHTYYDEVDANDSTQSVPTIALKDCDEILWNEETMQHRKNAYNYLIPKEDFGTEVNANTHGIFHMRGHSMKQKIAEGARVLIVWNSEPQDGRISLVYRKDYDGCTLKLLVQEKEHWYLHWCNGSNKKEMLSVDDRIVGLYVQPLKRWRCAPAEVCCA